MHGLSSPAIGSHLKIHGLSSPAIGPHVKMHGLSSPAIGSHVKIHGFSSPARVSFNEERDRMRERKDRLKERQETEQSLKSSSCELDLNNGATLSVFSLQTNWSCSASRRTPCPQCQKQELLAVMPMPTVLLYTSLLTCACLLTLRLVWLVWPGLTGSYKGARRVMGLVPEKSFRLVHKVLGRVHEQSFRWVREKSTIA